METKEVGIYIHIPFCRTKCPYCDFVRQPISSDIPRTFFEALKTEILSLSGSYRVKSIYFGGGTPSLMTSDQIAFLLGVLARHFGVEVLPSSEASRLPVEITMEVNPDDVTASRVSDWKELGINRLSIGVQSFSDEVLKYLGRRHDAQIAVRACEIVAKSYRNWSMDLIYGALPVETWESTLSMCKIFDPPHVSTYGLTYEQGTPFEAKQSEKIDDDVSLNLYRQARQELCSYVHYEISNFAKTGFEARHNLIYWTNEEYAGFGPGAYSFLGNVRSRNTADLDEYINFPGKKSEKLLLSNYEVELETLIQYFRLARGLDKSYYERRFGHPVTVCFGEKLQVLFQRGLLVEDEHTIRPTASGFELNNEIGLVLVD